MSEQLAQSLQHLPIALQVHIAQCVEEEHADFQCQLEHYCKFHHTLHQLLYSATKPVAGTSDAIKTLHKYHGKRHLDKFRLLPPDTCLFPYLRVCLKRAVVEKVAKDLEPLYISQYPFSLASHCPLPIEVKPTATHIAWYHFQRFKQINRTATAIAAAAW